MSNGPSNTVTNGRTHLRHEHGEGTISVWDPPRTLEYGWTFTGERESVLRMELEPLAGGTRLTLVHRALGEQYATGYGAGWHAYLDRLVALMDHDEDLDWGERFAIARRRILELLAERDRTAGEIAAEFEVSRPAVSRHLRVLREAELVSSEAQAQRRLHRLEPAPLDELSEWLARTRAFWTNRLDALEEELRRVELLVPQQTDNADLAEARPRPRP
ncbi:hypothetical protein BH23ACT5_BH23ACT5_12730 [soil metagenome]